MSLVEVRSHRTGHGRPRRLRVEEPSGQRTFFDTSADVTVILVVCQAEKKRTLTHTESTWVLLTAHESTRPSFTVACLRQRFRRSAAGHIVPK